MARWSNAPRMEGIDSFDWFDDAKFTREIKPLQRGNSGVNKLFTTA